MELSQLKALQSTTDLGDLLVGSIPVALSLCDAKGQLLWFNRWAEELWGCRPAAVSEMGRTGVVGAPEPAMVPAHSAVALALMRGERVMGMEETVLRPDGSCRVVAADVEPLRGEGGVVVGALAAYFDVSQHKELERALLEHSEGAEKEVRRHSSLLENCADGIALISEGGALIYLSPSARDITGYPPEELLGHQVGEFVHPDDLAGVKERFAAVVQRPGGTLTKEFRFRHKDGSWRRMECRDRNLLHDPAVRAVLTNFTDITDRRELERQVAQSSKMEALGRLAGGVAHDFNNLLTVINGMTEMLLERTSADDSRRRSLQMLQTAGERAADLTRQLLAFSRQQVVPAQPLDLKDAVAKVEGMLGRLIGEDIELRTSIGPDPVTVMADPGQMEQIILNLCLNARDAMPSGGRLTLGLRLREVSGRDLSAPRRAAPGEYAVLVVEDTGVGMDPSIINRIFEPFFTTKEGMGKGTGLGLSTVYGIAQQMGGTVEVSSMPGEGSRFEVWLPLCADAKVNEPSSVNTAPVPEGRETILLVEDEDTVRDLVAQVLAAHGYRVLKARHGEDALEVLQSFSGSVDLLLTDVVMPRMGGRELAERVEAQRPGTPVIFMSGYTDDVTLRNGVWSCERVYLQKPFRMGDLARRIREVLDAQATPPRT